MHSYITLCYNNIWIQLLVFMLYSDISALMRATWNQPTLFEFSFLCPPFFAFVALLYFVQQFFLIIGRGFLVKLTGINHPHFMEHENPLPCSQEPIGGPYHESDLSPTPPSNSNFLTIAFITTLIYARFFLSVLFLRGFETNSVCIIFFSHTRSSYPALLIFLALIILVIV